MSERIKAQTPPSQGKLASNLYDGFKDAIVKEGTDFRAIAVQMQCTYLPDGKLEVSRTRWYGNTMATSLTAQLGILPASQRRLWDELTVIPPDFVLYGGTAIALHLGHRNSVDFDFFTRQSFDPDQLLDNLEILNGCHVIQKQKNTLTVIVDRSGPVNISFLGVPRLGQINEPLLTDVIQLKVASLVDLAATKAGVVQKRAEAKDYIDLDAIIHQAKISLPQALAAAAAIYGPQYNPELTLKSLCYYDDGNLPSVPKQTRNRLVNSVNNVDLANLPVINAIIPWSS